MSPESKTDRQGPAVTIVVPVRDEDQTIGATLASLASQTVGPESLEVLVYDGNSEDATARVCRGFAGAHAWRRFELVENRPGTVAHALNAGLEQSTSPWFMRLDGRTSLSPNYVAECLTALAGAGKFGAAGGRLRAEAEGSVATAIAAAVTHPLGVGQGFRVPQTEPTEVPHHPFALWRTGDVRELGGFNPSLVRNQDDEFSMRAARSGARVLLIPSCEVVYRPRERLRGLAWQYFQYGLWKSVVARKSGLYPARSLLPPAAALVWLYALALAASGRRKWPLAAVAAAYIGAGEVASRRYEGAGRMTTAAALCALHTSYGIGVVAGFVRPKLARGRLGVGRIC